MSKQIYHYDPYSPNNIERMRQTTFSGMHKQRNETHDGLRFCECCSKRKPKNNRPHVKGWKCDDCATVH